MKGFNGPELRPPGGSGLKREAYREAYRTFRVVFIVDEPRVYRAPSAF